MLKIEDELYKNIKSKIEKLVEDIVLEIEKEVVNVIKENDIIMDGSLRKSISSDVIDRSTSETISYLGKVFGNVNYAVFVHEGTKPHFPPIEPIMHWVKRKGIGQQFYIKSKRAIATKRKSVRTKSGFSEQKYSSEVRSVAYAIAKSISRKGTRGIKFFEMALAQARPEITRRIKETL